MIRILVCDPDAGDRSQLRSAVDALVKLMDISNCGIAYVTKLEELIALAQRTNPGFYDIVVCRVGPEADQALEALREVRAADANLGIVIASDSPDHAVDAFDLHVDGYCLFKDGRDGFERAMKVPLLKAAAKHADTVGVRSEIGIGNVTIDEIQFVEASKKGPLVHLPEGKTLLARGSLQSMFELLEGDGPFIKAGNSFIVNLDNVRSFGESSIIFPDGEAIIIPVRARKAVKEALYAHRLRPEYVAAALAG